MNVEITAGFELEIYDQTITTHYVFQAVVEATVYRILTPVLHYYCPLTTNNSKQLRIGFSNSVNLGF